jgi:drug/metabolite transporter (DMT)-like permease
MLDRTRPAASGQTAAAIAALVMGAAAMGISPVFVRVAEVGPFASAFWRVALALPALWLWARIEAGGARGKPVPPWSRSVVVAGILFACDLFFWHLSILKTTMANATLLAVLAPVWVALGSGLFIGERVERIVFAGLALCLAGAAALVGTSFAFAPERLLGDLYGLATSLFFGGYFLAVRFARRTTPSGLLLYRSSLVTAAILFAVAVVVEGDLLPATLWGAAALVLLAFVSHLGGQGLLAYALGHLSATFSSLVIFLEALFAALFGLAFFGEAVTATQTLGAAAILAGIWVARPRPSRAPSAASLP